MGANMNNKVDYILTWFSALEFIEQNDKASIPIEQHVPISSTAQNTVCALVSEGTSVLAANHGWNCKKIGPAVTGGFNIGTRVADVFLMEVRIDKGIIFYLYIMLHFNIQLYFIIVQVY